jgi:hypothetical protein
MMLDDHSFYPAYRRPDLDLSMNLDHIDPIETRLSQVSRIPNPYNTLLIEGEATIEQAGDVVMQNNTRDVKSTIVVPVQVMQHKGIAYPWYGMVTKDNNLEPEYAYDLGPMYSGNIGAFVCDNDECDDSDWEDVAENKSYHLCTGVRPLMLLDSFGTLNVNNHDSSYHKHACDIHPVDIKKAMIKETLAVLKS